MAVSRGWRGSATIALPGIEVEVVSAQEGTPVGPNEKGIMVIKRPFPGPTPALWGEPERYGQDYWQRLPGVYYTGDSAQIDEDRFIWQSGRAPNDDPMAQRLTVHWVLIGAPRAS